MGLVANIINTFSLDFMMPISLVDQNMLRAQEQDAIFKSKFWWRTDMFDDGHDYTQSELQASDFLFSSASNKSAMKIQELYLWQILEGDATVGLSKGLVSLFREIMELKNWADE